MEASTPKSGITVEESKRLDGGSTLELIQWTSDIQSPGKLVYQLRLKLRGSSERREPQEQICQTRDLLHVAFCEISSIADFEERFPL